MLVNNCELRSSHEKGWLFQALKKMNLISEEDEESEAFLKRKNSLNSSNSGSSKTEVGDNEQNLTSAMLRKKSYLNKNVTSNRLSQQASSSPVKHFSFNGIQGGNEEITGIRKSTKLKNANSLAVPIVSIIFEFVEFKLVMGLT